MCLSLPVYSLGIDLLHACLFNEDMNTPETMPTDRSDPSQDPTVTSPTVNTQSAPIQPPSAGKPVWKWLSIGLIIIVIVAIAVLAISMMFFGLKINFSTSSDNTQTTATSSTPTPTSTPSITPTPIALPAGWAYQTSALCQLKIALPPKAEPYTEKSGNDVMYWKYSQQAFDNKTYIATAEQKALGVVSFTHMHYYPHDGEGGDGFGSTVDVYCSGTVSSPKTVDAVADMYTKAYEQIPPTKVSGTQGEVTMDPNKVTSRQTIKLGNQTAIKLDTRYYEGYYDEYKTATVNIVVANNRYYIAEYRYWQGYPKDATVGQKILDTIVF